MPICTCNIVELWDGGSMLTFREVAAKRIAQYGAGNLNCDLLFAGLGEIDIRNLSSERITNCLTGLYDNVKLRGAVFTSYRKFIAEVCQFAFDEGYITEIPKIELRSSEVPNLFNKPDDSAM